MDNNEFDGMGDDILKYIGLSKNHITTCLHELLFYVFVGRRIRDPNSDVSTKYLNIVDINLVKIDIDEDVGFTVILTVIHDEGKEENICISNSDALFELQVCEDESFVFEYWKRRGIILPDRGNTDTLDISTDDWKTTEEEIQKWDLGEDLDF